MLEPTILPAGTQVVILREGPDCYKKAIILAHQGVDKDGANIYAAYDAVLPKRTLWITDHEFTSKRRHE